MAPKKNHHSVIEKNSVKRFFCSLVLFSFILASLQPLAYAELISTDKLLQIQSENDAKERLRLLLQRQDIRQALTQMGVPEQIALQRVAALSDNEARQFAAEIEQMPAGSGVLGSLVLVFLVLLATDILGYTDIFPFVVRSDRPQNSNKPNNNRKMHKSFQ